MQGKESFWRKWKKYVPFITVIVGLLTSLTLFFTLRQDIQNAFGWPPSAKPHVGIVHESKPLEGTGKTANAPSSPVKTPPPPEKLGKPVSPRVIQPEMYINTAIVRTGHPRKVAILVWQTDGESLVNVESLLAQQVGKSGLQPVRSFFAPAFVRDGLAQSLLEGDWAPARNLGLRSHVDYILLGFAKTQYAHDQDFEGLLTAHLELKLTCLDLVHQTACGNKRFDSQGAGYRDDTALGVALDHMQSKLHTFVGKAF